MCELPFIFLKIKKLRLIDCRPKVMNTKALAGNNERNTNYYAIQPMKA
jgi:hypothetical protein